MKSIASISLLVVISISCYGNVDAGMTCAEVLGIPFTCPLPFQDESRAFCCYDSNNMPSCCNFPDYFLNNTGIIAGVVIGAIVLLLLITLCCCCCCSCCLLAKRRQRGTIIYDPISPVQPQAPPLPVYISSTSYPLQPTVHLPPPPSYSAESQLPYNPAYPKRS